MTAGRFLLGCQAVILETIKAELYGLARQKAISMPENKKKTSKSGQNRI